MASEKVGDGTRRAVVRVIFLSLLLDLMAFTMPLPLFPRLISSFVEAEKRSNTKSSTLSRTLEFVRSVRTALVSASSSHPGSATLSRHNPKWDVTLLGGLLGSVFSLCQFAISPHLGALSDRHGRRPVLLATMAGNVLSAAIWLLSPSFGPYLVSRIVGGLSEGNVQLAIAIISDVSSEADRARSLALVGIAFSVSFTFGPILGAWFATLGSRDGRRSVVWAGREVNLYAAPAVVSLGLLVVETAYLAVALPETRWLKRDAIREDQGKKGREERPVKEREAKLARLRRLHLFFLLVFSGAEFTITFLTFDLFSFTSAQNGRLLGLIGVVSSLLQGGVVRRSKASPARFVRSGISSCVGSLVLLALLPAISSARSSPERQIDGASSVALYLAAVLLAYVSASVVNSLNTLASLESDDSGPLSRGETLGKHRSAGQLGRAFGPILATGLYWTFGPAWAYGASAVAMALVGAMAVGLEDGKKRVE